MPTTSLPLARQVLLTDPRAGTYNCDFHENPKKSDNVS